MDGAWAHLLVRDAQPPQPFCAQRRAHGSKQVVASALTRVAPRACRWFDHNWGFSIPPPLINASRTSRVWEGLDNAAWGSHIYYASVAAVDQMRTQAGDTWYGGRPMTLTKFGLPDWRPGMDPVHAAESPAQHRFPVCECPPRLPFASLLPPHARRSRLSVPSRQPTQPVYLGCISGASRVYLGCISGVSRAVPHPRASHPAFERAPHASAPPCPPTAGRACTHQCQPTAGRACVHGLPKGAHTHAHAHAHGHMHMLMHMRARAAAGWTGDGVNLQASVESMVDSGVHGFKPYVHSDCGGDYRGNAGDLLRWTGHCVFGTILRFHGNDHRPWTYTDHVTATIKRYLKMRYSLLPSLIAGGAEASASAFPIAARADLHWPSYAEARSNDQYVWLNDTLVAPIFDSKANVTTRAVWFPPGEWHDAWNGTVVRGPATLAVTQPYERIPMWHRAGGLVVLAGDRDATRVDEQDWSTLTLEVHPARGEAHTARTVVERATGATTPLALLTDGHGSVRLKIGVGPVARAWTARVHLHPKQRVVSCTLDGRDVMAQTRLLDTRAAGESAPFGGRGTAPAMLAGPVFEVDLPSSRATRDVELKLA